MDTEQAHRLRVTDERKTRGLPSVGYQPGRWRLVLGQCAVGALARARTPRHDQIREQGFRDRARIIDLSVENGNGRVRSRIRRRYRPSHARVISVSEDLTIGTWNMQGANWSMTETWHVSKFRCLVLEMRAKSIDIMCVTDLHGQLDEEVGVDTRHSTCMIDEYVLVQCGRVGFMLHPSVVAGWVGEAVCWDAGGRVATMDITLDGCSLRIGSVYMPVHGTEGEIARWRVLGFVREAHAEFESKGCVIFGGDWNSHIGRDGVAGRQAMSNGSTAGGKLMLNWMAEPANRCLTNVDHKIPSRSRGTWCHRNTGIWYELDYFVASSEYVGRFGGVSTFAVGESDHASVRLMHAVFSVHFVRIDLFRRDLKNQCFMFRVPPQIPLPLTRAVVYTYRAGPTY